MNTKLKKDLMEFGFEYQGQDSFILALELDKEGTPVIYAFLKVLKHWNGGNIFHLTLRNNRLDYIKANKGKSLLEVKDFESLEEVKAYLLGE